VTTHLYLAPAGAGKTRATIAASDTVKA